MANTIGTPGVVAYETAGWTADRDGGLVAQVLRHAHAAGRVAYSVTPPVGSDHSAIWLHCGVDDQPAPGEHAVRDLEHGAVGITCRPPLRNSKLRQLQGSNPARHSSGRPGPAMST